MITVQYVYRARLISLNTWPSFKDGATDGDTMIFAIDLGFKTYPHHSIRVKDLNTAELNSTNPLERQHALEAREAAEQLLAGVDVILQTFKQTASVSFNRYVAAIQLPDGRDFATVMKALGMERKETY